MIQLQLYFPDNSNVNSFTHDKISKSYKVLAKGKYIPFPFPCSFSFLPPPVPLLFSFLLPQVIQQIF